MCGLTGYWETEAKNQAVLRARVTAMVNTLSHRGPDDQGLWTGANSRLALGFRRLAIMDLSPAGHQPMTSASGRYVIAFNGEIYNSADLRNELCGLGHAFRGHSDTEVMLASIERWGLRPAIGRFVGMFAFALWDCRMQTLCLVRDRLGIKPLYYGRMGGTFLWGSELKALRAHPSFAGEIDRSALSLLMRYGYIPAPYSIYKGVYKLRPGTILTIVDPGRNGDSAPNTSVTYWSAPEVAEQGMNDPFRGTDQDAILCLDERLREAVRLRMIADVPVGAFLSGGIDSSTVVALMQRQNTRPAKTFTIGFERTGYNEALYARGVAQYLGTDHQDLYVTSDEAQKVIPRLPDLYDEPFSDPSQIPTFLLSEMTRRYVTVSLSGDGGDELFGGYERYSIAAAIWKKVGPLPVGLRQWIARGIGDLVPGRRARVLAEFIGIASPEALYQRLVSHWKAPAELVAGGCEPPITSAGLERIKNGSAEDFLRYMTGADIVSYLPDDILVKVDRASMAVALEARVPLLDHRVVEFAARLPLAMKMRRGKGKWILRKVLERYVPPKMTDRPKMGFGVPLGNWLRGALRDWAEDLLAESRLKADGYFHPEPIRRKWAEHLSGRHDWQFYLWDVLMFQAWLENQRATLITSK